MFGRTEIGSGHKPVGATEVPQDPGGAPQANQPPPAPNLPHVPAAAQAMQRGLAAASRSLLFFKHDADENRDNIELLVDLLANLLNGADLGAARARLLALGGRDIAQSATKLAVAVITASAAETLDRLGENDIDEVRRAVRNLMDDLTAAGIGGAYGSLHVGLDGWMPDAPGVALRPTAAPIVGQLDDLLMRADTALSDPTFAGIVGRLRHALVPNLPSVKLQRMALRGGDDFFSRVDALRNALARVEQPQPGDNPDASYQALEAAILKVDRLFVRLGLLYDDDAAEPSPPNTPPVAGRRNA